MKNLAREKLLVEQLFEKSSQNQEHDSEQEQNQEPKVEQEEYEEETGEDAEAGGEGDEAEEDHKEDETGGEEECDEVPRHCSVEVREHNPTRFKKMHRTLCAHVRTRSEQSS